MLKDHRDVLDSVIQLLMTKETVDGSEIYRLAGRPEPERGAPVTMAPDRGPGSAAMPITKDREDRVTTPE